VKRDVSLGVTAEAVGFEMSGFATPHRRHVLVLVIALQRMIARGMAIHAARMRDEFADFAEYRARTLGLVRDRSKFRRAFKRMIAV